MALVGYMGSGKSTVGRILARRTGRKFVDLDREVSRRARRSIPEIFAESGEARFRDLEHNALRSALERPGRVIACGGGAVLRPENRALLKTARTVFLQEDLGTLYERTRSPGRPLQGSSYEEFERRYRERLPLYREVARCTVRVDGRPPGAVAEEIREWLRG